jgi:hypothetical protein
MRVFASTIMILISGILVQSFAQTRTDETKRVVQKTEGDTTLIESVTISVSEDVTPRNSMIIINPLKFFLFYNLSYYARVAPGVAIGAGFQVPTISGLDGYGLNAEVRLHPSEKTLRGFYLAPNFSYNRLYSNEDDGSLSAFSLGGLIGWQWFPGDEFAIGLGIGVDYYMSSATNAGDDFESYKGFAPALRFDIGYAW